MNINTSNYYSVSGSANKGISGLASGLDTESMVKQMLSGTQAKIDKQQALKQQTAWKQDIYQDVIKSVNGFYEKYFDSSYGAALKTNFASAAFFDSMVSEIKSGDAVTVVGTGVSATAGEMHIAVKELASAAVMTSTRKMSGSRTIVGAAVDESKLAALFDKTVVFRAGEKTVSIDLNRVKTGDELVQTVNRAFSDAGVTGVTAKLYNGCLRVVTDQAGLQLSVDGSSTQAGLKATGMTGCTATTLVGADGAPGGAMLQSSAIDLNAGLSFELTLNGVSKTVVLNPARDSAGNFTLETVRATLQEQAKKAFGDYITVGTDATGKKLQLSLNVGGQEGHELNITGADAAKLGFTPGDSTLIGGRTKLSALGMSGGRAVFTINGTQFSLSADDTVDDLVSRINSSDAGVRILYSALSDTFRMEASSTGAQYGIALSQQEGNLLGMLFGENKIHAASSVASRELTTGQVTGKAGGLAASYETGAASLAMEVNGAKYTFTLPQKTGAVYTKTEIEASFQSWLTDTFGKNAAGEANLAYRDGNLAVAEGFVVKFAQTKTDTENARLLAEAEKSDLALAFGFSTHGATNVANGSTPLAQVPAFGSLTALDQNGNPAATLADVRTVNGFSATCSGGRLVLSGTGAVDLAGQAKLQELFGAAGFALADGAAAADAVTAGREAHFTVNGTDIYRSSNTVTIDGLTLALTKVSPETVSAAGVATGYEETVVGTRRDAEQIVAGFQSFVKDYNAMLDKLNGYVDEQPNYRKYAPLTDEQKKEMSEREIELWEEKAKQGLVRRDTNITDFLSQMRTALYSKPGGTGLALYNIGIETKTWESKGKLSLDETALRAVLATDPEAVKRLFTEASSGLAAQITAITNAAARVSVGSPGTLVKLAGAEGWSANAKNNTFYKHIKNIEDRLGDLKDKYQAEQQRYWAQFNYMEKVLANYNTQSSMVSQYFSGAQ